MAISLGRLTPFSDKPRWMFLFPSPMCSNPKEVLEQLGFYQIFFKLELTSLQLWGVAKQRYWNLFLCNFLGSRKTGIQLVFTPSFMIPHLKIRCTSTERIENSFLPFLNDSGIRPDFKKRTFGNAAATAIAIAAGADMAGAPDTRDRIPHEKWVETGGLTITAITKVKSNGNAAKMV